VSHSTASIARKLRPQKVRRAVRRRWFEGRVARTQLAHADGLVDLGGSYGGWRVPGHLLQPGWICYSVGAGGDISFDLDLIHRYDMTVRSFDAVADYVERARQHAGGEPRFSAHQAALAVSDGPLRMQITHDEGSKSVSPAGLYESSTYVELPGRSLTSLMAELGDERIDLLKVDIEGGEYAVVPTLDLPAIGVKVFAVQLHHTGTVRQARALISHLERAGYEPVATKPAVKLAFARRELLDGGGGLA
jgi:FkbM family methyltransferase